MCDVFCLNYLYSVFSQFNSFDHVHYHCLCKNACISPLLFGVQDAGLISSSRAN